jgi:hypothetical protein
MRYEAALILMLGWCAVALGGARVLVPGESRVGPVPAVPGDGLDTAVWHYGVNNINSAVAHGTTNPADASFRATHVDYPNGGDNIVSGDVSLLQFLGADAASYAGPVDGVLGEIFHFTGFLAVPAARVTHTFAVGSDDGMRLLIGGVNVLEQGGDRPFNFTIADVQFELEGLYPIELWYYANLQGESGVELYSSIPGGPDSGTPFFGGSVIPVASLYRIPEPVSSGLFALAVLLARRRFSASR